MVCVGHNHYVYGNKKEIEEYKAIREKGEPIKSITILKPGEERAEKTQTSDTLSGSNYILTAPSHDTGSFWYTIGSFFLPVFGLIGGFLFKHFKYFRNYKACKKGAIVGFAILGGIVAIFLLCLLLAIL
jgi:oligopeptide transport system ATP-binding protein